jgi:predicted ATP-dependent serine protease
MVPFYFSPILKSQLLLDSRRFTARKEDPLAGSGVANESIPMRQLRKMPTGIDGFEEITSEGVPQGRPTLICGGPGSGKTLFVMEFLVRGA